MIAILYYMKKHKLIIRKRINITSNKNKYNTVTFISINYSGFILFRSQILLKPFCYTFIESIHF